MTTVQWGGTAPPQPGIIGYSVCRKDSTFILAGLESACEAPDEYQSSSYKCAFDSGPLCVLDVILGGSLSAYASCPKALSGQPNEQCAELAALGILAYATPIGKGIGRALEAVFVRRELVQAGLGAIKASVTNGTTVEVTVDNEILTLTSAEARALLDDVVTYQRPLSLQFLGRLRHDALSGSKRLHRPPCSQEKRHAYPDCMP